MAKVYSVVQISNYIKNMFESDFVLENVSVSGEVSNCKYHSSGHIYFTLKDKGATISAVMFSGNRMSGLWIYCVRKSNPVFFYIFSIITTCDY